MPIQLVIDSSVVVKWFHQKEEKYLEQADKIIKDAQSGSVLLMTPELVKYEVGNALLFSKKLSEEEASVPLASLYSLPIEFISETEELAKKTYRIAQQSGITYYDASFMALAKQERATLVTDNPKHQGKQMDMQVIPLKDY